jgi:hypothetical protein
MSKVIEQSGDRTRRASLATRMASVATIEGLRRVSLAVGHRLRTGVQAANRYPPIDPLSSGVPGPAGSTTGVALSSGEGSGHEALVPDPADSATGNPLPSSEERHETPFVPSPLDSAERIHPSLF